MAKRGAGASDAPVPPRICFERILPDRLDAGAEERRKLRRHLVAASPLGSGPSEYHHAARMAVQLTKKWESGQTVKCRFLDGTKRWHGWVQEMAQAWPQYANVTLRFVKSGDAQIRISFFADNGSWSAVGRDALNRHYFPKDSPTMNFGWIREGISIAARRSVVLHEFGHALGCLHEHEGPNFTRKWNRAAVMKYFSGPPNYWSKAEILHNVLDKLNEKTIAATKYDPASIMLYAFPAELFSDNKGPTKENTTLSRRDKGMIGRMYP